MFSGRTNNGFEPMVARITVLTSILVAGLLVSGCGSEVELKGGVFDALGVSGVQGARRDEPEMANRPGLVIPPSTASLPAPGKKQPDTALAANGEAFPVNPEDAKRMKAADILRRHNEFCEKSRQREKIGLATAVEDSPWGSCHESALRNLTGKDIMGRPAVKAQ